jgi:hypothetical protein
MLPRARAPTRSPGENMTEKGKEGPGLGVQEWTWALGTGTGHVRVEDERGQKLTNPFPTESPRVPGMAS